MTSTVSTATKDPATSRASVAGYSGASTWPCGGRGCWRWRDQRIEISVGSVVRAVILVAAVGLAVHFAPLRLGSEVELEAIGDRLWFDGWR